MSVWDRIRSFWRPAPQPDHPLTDAERDGQPPDSAFDTRARELDELAGNDFDPDDCGAARG